MNNETNKSNRGISRREFLKIGVIINTIHQEDNPDQPSAKNIDQSEVKLPELTRREFIFASALTGMVLLSTYLTLKSGYTEAKVPQKADCQLPQPIRGKNIPVENKQNTNENLDIFDNKNEEKKKTYFDTFKETNVLLAAEFFTSFILEKFGIKSGISGSEEIGKFIRENSLPTIIGEMGIFVPVLEEIIFRLSPSALLSFFGQKGSQWKFGIPISAIFAACHGLKTPEGNVKIPLPQLASGLYLWKLIRERGFLHASLSHSTVNTEIVALAKILLKSKK